MAGGRTFVGASSGFWMRHPLPRRPADPNQKRFALWKLHEKAQIFNMCTRIKGINTKRSKVSAQRRNLAGPDAKLRRVLAYGLGHVARCEKAVMSLDHLRVGVAEVLADDDQRHSGHDGEGSPSVAQAMKTDRRADPRVQTCLSHQRGLIRRSPRLAALPPKQDLVRGAAGAKLAK